MDHLDEIESVLTKWQDSLETRALVLTVLRYRPGVPVGASIPALLNIGSAFAMGAGRPAAYGVK